MRSKGREDPRTRPGGQESGKTQGRAGAGPARGPGGSFMAVELPGSHGDTRACRRQGRQGLCARCGKPGSNHAPAPWLGGATTTSLLPSLPCQVVANIETEPYYVLQSGGAGSAPAPHCLYNYNRNNVCGGGGSPSQEECATAGARCCTVLRPNASSSSGSEHDNGRASAHRTRRPLGPLHRSNFIMALLFATFGMFALALTRPEVVQPYLALIRQKVDVALSHAKKYTPSPF